VKDEFWLGFWDAFPWKLYVFLLLLAAKVATLGMFKNLVQRWTAWDDEDSGGFTPPDN